MSEGLACNQRCPPTIELVTARYEPLTPVANRAHPSRREDCRAAFRLRVIRSKGISNDTAFIPPTEVRCGEQRTLHDETLPEVRNGAQKAGHLGSTGV
jgi:hypothetical protein